MIWFICSGSGGTGKSSAAAALAQTEAAAGKSVILLDASGPAHTCDALLGTAGKALMDLGDTISGEAAVSAVLYETAFRGLRYVMADHEAVPVLAEYTESFLTLQSMCDLLIVDMSTGDSGLDAEIIREEDRFILVTRGDFLSLRAAEQSLDHFRRYGAEVSLIVNQIPDTDRHALRNVQEKTEMTLGYTPDCLIPWRPEKENPKAAGEPRVNAAVLQAAAELCRKWRNGN